MAKPRAGSRKADQLIERLYARECSGIQVPIMSIPGIYKVARDAIDAGKSEPEIATALKAATLAAAA